MPSFLVGAVVLPSFLGGAEAESHQMIYNGTRAQIESLSLDITVCHSHYNYELGYLASTFYRKILGSVLAMWYRVQRARARRHRTDPAAAHTTRGCHCQVRR